MRIGRNIRDLEIPFKDEIDFSIKNKFDIVQLWYKRGKVDMVYEDNTIDAIRRINIPSILHGTFDVNDFDDYADDFIELLVNLNHKEVILHPMIKTEEINQKTSDQLVEKVLKLCHKLNDYNITVYVENNHERMKVFYTIEQWKYFWSKAPSNTEFLLDIVHVIFCDDYDYMKKLVNIKYPKCIHIADTIKGMVGKKHLHLPLGYGIIDWNIVFKDILRDFDGLIIIEIKNTDQLIIESKNKLITYLNNK